MNVLLYVVTMLMVMVLMSYARLETFRNDQVFQILFTHYMHNDERAILNEGFKNKYDDVKVSRKPSRTDKPDNDKKSQPKISASPRVSLSLFINQEKRSAQPEQYQQASFILKNLLHVLYSRQPFYQALIEENAHFPEALIAALVETIDALPSQNKPKKVQDLSNLVLADPTLNDALYKIMHGAPEKYEGMSEKEEAADLKIEDKIEDTSQDIDLLAAESEEHHSPKGYVSIADFITFLPSTQIRVFLASPEVLEAVFPDTHTVQEILQMRKELHRQIISKADSKELENAFKSRFEPLRNPAIEAALLNFQVSKTDPKKYE